MLVNEGPEAVRELIALGANFDHSPEGVLSLTREGGHHRDRIAHAGGDATGAEIQRALVAAIHAAPDIEVVEHALAVDLLLAADGGVAGITLHVMGEGQRDGVGAVRCRAVVLASGGLGQVFSQTTNPAVSTGDGMALALRAGAVLRDLEFVQFHPTVMYLGPDSRGQQPLISEAVRGEGAFLVDFEGDRFMQGQHELADLAPRDVVAKAITRRMHETGHPHMWLDARHLGPAFWEKRFPTILATCREHGVDPVTELIPVAPACHYASGGVATDLWGRSARARPLRDRRGRLLRACTAPTGSPPTRCSRAWSSPGGSRRCCPPSCGRTPTPVADERPAGLVVGRRSAPTLQAVMTEQAGRAALRRRARRHALDELAALAGKAGEIGTRAWEATNLVTISTALAEAARAARGDPRLALARGLPGPRRRALVRPRRRHAGPGTASSSTFHAGSAVATAAARMKPTPYDDLPRRPARRADRGGPGPARRLRRHRAARSRRTCRAAATTSPARRRSPRTPAASPTSRRASPGSWPASASPRWSSRTCSATTSRSPTGSPDGTTVGAGDVVMRVAGPTRGLLTAERTALNFASHLSGVATATSRWVDALEGTSARVLDTRKTLPGLARAAEVRRALRRRRQPPVQPQRHGDGQGQPRARRRWRGAGLRGGPRGPSRASRSRSR